MTEDDDDLLLELRWLELVWTEMPSAPVLALRACLLAGRLDELPKWAREELVDAFSYDKTAVSWDEVLPGRPNEKRDTRSILLREPKGAEEAWIAVRVDALEKELGPRQKMKAYEMVAKELGISREDVRRKYRLGRRVFKVWEF
jgi:hypothetical protein